MGFDKNKRKYSFQNYDPAWVKKFQEIKKYLELVFEGTALKIEHVGSTSIPDMKAKPIIDILVVVEKMQPFLAERAKMIAHGYEWGENYIGPNTQLFFKMAADGSKLENIHICENGSPKEKQFLIMCDFFRTFPEKAKEYGDLKEKNFSLYPDDYPAYRAAKESFLKKMEQEAYEWFEGKSDDMQTTPHLLRVDFFEEYPTEENLKKAALIDFPSTIYLAAHSLEEFHLYKKQLHQIDPQLTAAYWPIIPHTYWISPFAYTKDLKHVFTELKTTPDPLTVLIDLELPLPKYWFYYVRNIFSFSKNKKLIGQFFKEASSHNLEIVTAEYPTTHRFILKILQGLGIMYDFKTYPHRSCMMYYTSMLAQRSSIKRTGAVISHIRKELNPALELGLGTIATGVLGNEPILPPQDLARDLEFAKKNAIKTVTIFRLGGLTSEYCKVIKPFVI